MYKIYVKNLTLTLTNEDLYIQLLEDLEDGTLETKINWLLAISETLQRIEKKLDGKLQNITTELTKESIKELEPIKKSKGFKIGKINSENVESKSILSAFSKF